MEDGKEYCGISTAECLVILLCVLPIDIVFTELFHQPFRGFVAALSSAVVIGLVWILRPLSKQPIFWACIVTIAALHLVVIYFLPYTGDFRFGFALFPVAALDIYGFAKIIISLCRHY